MEWANFAEYKVNPIAASKNWEEELRQGTSNMETRWNLAVVYLRIKKHNEALRLLQSASNLPFRYLKFGLYIALEIYKKTQEGETEGKTKAIKFLSEHLTKLPFRECYIVHLLIKLEENKQMNLMDYEYLETYTKICFRKIELLDTTSKKLRYEDLNEFRAELLELELIDAWLIWITDYSDNHYFDLGAWKLLSDAYL